MFSGRNLVCENLPPPRSPVDSFKGKKVRIVHLALKTGSFQKV